MRLPEWTYSSRWIGAWWLGFPIIGVCILLLVIPLALFPERLPKQKTDATLKTKTQADSFAEMTINSLWLTLQFENVGSKSMTPPIGLKLIIVKVISGPRQRRARIWKGWPLKAFWMTPGRNGAWTDSSPASRGSWLPWNACSQTSCSCTTLSQMFSMSLPSWGSERSCPSFSSWTSA